MVRAMLWLSVVLALFVCALPRHPAHALDSQDDEARALFEAGLVAFESARFESALLYFSRSLALSKRAKLHYNIGLTLERLERSHEAVEAYSAYLTALPDADNRDEVEARLSILRSAAPPLVLAIPARETAPPPVVKLDQRAPLKKTHLRSKRLAIGLLASGGALALGGGALVLLAQHAKNKVEDAPQGGSWPALEDDEARVKPLSITGFTVLGAGAAALTVGTVLLFKARSRRLDVALQPYGLRIRGTF